MVNLNLESMQLQIFQIGGEAGFQFKLWRLID